MSINDVVYLSASTLMLSKSQIILPGIKSHLIDKDPSSYGIRLVLLVLIVITHLRTSCVVENYIVNLKHNEVCNSSNKSM